MAAEHSEHEHHDHTSHYVKIWGILLVLLLVSVVGPEIGALTGISAITLVTAFGIAVVKAWLVLKHFMHVNTEQKMVWYILSGAVILMFLMFFGVAADVMNHEGSRWENVAAKAEIERALAEQAAGGGHHGEHGGDHGEGDHGDAAHGEGSHEGGAEHKEDAGGHH